MRHPYENAPPYRRWRQGVAQLAPDQFDPVVRVPFTLQAQDRIVSAGSCFAQHIARHLRLGGFNFIDTEPAHPLLPAVTASAYNYGIYSARYGNVYTARQLLQLLRRAYGRFVPREDRWEKDGRYFDPYRPAIQPGGFASREEFELDRIQHFAAVRQAFEQLDCFIFTLGLTESWLSREDGAAFPMCPGTSAGEFDPARHVFHNHTVDEVTSDLEQFITELRAVNPRARIILTVSPVPLAATADDQHVLLASTYSKAVLRVAAESATQRFPDVMYFPSFEIITGAQTRGSYFADDLRSINEAGVSHVMRVFFQRVCGVDMHWQHTDDAPAPIGDTFATDMRQVIDAVCEEASLDK